MNKRGFTLIELLVVIAIIGVLSSVVLASLSTARIKARNANRIATVKQVETALALYYNQYGYYPAYAENECGGTEGYTTSGNNFMASLVTAGFLPSYPVDPGNLNCGIQYAGYGPGYNYYYLFWDQEGQDAPAGGCNQPPTWYCKTP